MKIQEDKPVLWQCDFDDESKYVFSEELADKYESLGWRITKLYTRPDGLRKAAEEAKRVLSGFIDEYGGDEVDFSVLENLRAALEGK